MFTNINLIDEDKIYNYVIEYDRNSELSENSFYYIKSDSNTISFTNNDEYCIHHRNYWDITNASVCGKSNKYIPKDYSVSKFSLYFPDYSADLYHKNIKYVITIKTWIHGLPIILFSNIIQRSDALACDRLKKFENYNYYEKIDIPIIDPYELMYSDNWMEFRMHVCKEPSFNGKQVNSTGSILHISIHPVIENEIGYIKYNPVVGGQNSLNLTKDTNDFLNLNICTNLLTPLSEDDQPSIICKLKFNKEYNDNLDEYLLETYGLTKYQIRYRLVIGNKNELYAVIDGNGIRNSEYKFKKNDICKNNFNNGSGWKPGIFIVCSADIIDNQNESVISILSNTIPFTPEVFSYFVNSKDICVDTKIINNVNLNDLDMNILNINAINKIENQVIQLDSPDSSKSNIIQPIFFRTTELSNIIIHNEVTETICINLDRYKSQVKTFILQIEGIKFPEIGKTKSGVLFKIIGQQLPGVKTSGNYYILNENYDLVSSGKYNYA